MARSLITWIYQSILSRNPCSREGRFGRTGSRGLGWAGRGLGRIRAGRPSHRCEPRGIRGPGCGWDRNEPRPTDPSPRQSPLDASALPARTAGSTSGPLDPSARSARAGLLPAPAARSGERCRQPRVAPGCRGSKLRPGCPSGSCGRAAVWEALAAGSAGMARSPAGGRPRRAPKPGSRPPPAPLQPQTQPPRPGPSAQEGQRPGFSVTTTENPGRWANPARRPAPGAARAARRGPPGTGAGHGAPGAGRGPPGARRGPPGAGAGRGVRSSPRGRRGRGRRGRRLRGWRCRRRRGGAGR